MKKIKRAVGLLGALTLCCGLLTGLQSTAANAAVLCMNQTGGIKSSANNLYVSVELSSDARLRARSATSGPWEQLQICWTDSSHTAIDIIGGHGQVVSAEFGYQEPDYGMLRARAEMPGSWERFHCQPLAGGEVAFWSAARGTYVSAEVDREGLLRARGTSIGAWERFTIANTSVRNTFCGVI
jgi:hypothetical protein